MATGTLVLHRFNGDEEFGLSNCTIQGFRIEAGIRLNFEAEADGCALRSLPDTASLAAVPTAEVNISLPELDVARLVGGRFELPHGLDDDGELLGRLYYCEHEPLDDNVLRIIERKGDLFHVRWTASTQDVNYYDGSKSRSRIEIDAWFRFMGVEKWARGTGK